MLQEPKLFFKNLKIVKFVMKLIEQEIPEPPDLTYLLMDKTYILNRLV